MIVYSEELYFRQFTQDYGKIKACTRRTIEKSVAQVQREVRDEWKKEISTKLDFKQTSINDSYGIKVERISSAQFRVTIDSKNIGIDVSPRKHLIHLEEFKPRQTATGVSVNLKSGQVRTFRHAFLATMPSNGKEGIFIRKKIGGKRVGRLPIQGIYWTTSVEKIAENTLNQISIFTQKRLEQRFITNYKQGCDSTH